jgi:hypothetical protein
MFGLLSLGKAANLSTFIPRIGPVAAQNLAF